MYKHEKHNFSPKKIPQGEKYDLTTLKFWVMLKITFI